MGAKTDAIKTAYDNRQQPAELRSSLDQRVEQASTKDGLLKEALPHVKRNGDHALASRIQAALG